jgi:hypothetical protein
MQERSLVERVEILEKKVEALESLPERVTRVELQLVHLRDEMRDGFSALRAEIRGGDEVTVAGLRDAIRASEDETRRVLRDEIRTGDEETRRVLRDEIRAGDEETRRVFRLEIRAGDEETRQVLREEIRSGDEETRRYMRVLHEDVIARIAAISEAPRPRKKR